MKTAIIGVGRMGRRHIQVVREAGLKLSGVYDVSAASLKLAQDEHGLPGQLLFDDLDKLYAEIRPECVIVATTADSHCALTCMAAERGAKYILVEKPMAVSLAECDRMIEVCARHGTKLAVNHQMRFMEQYTEPKRLFATGVYGDFVSMTVVAGNCGLAMNGIHYFEAFRYLAGEALTEITAWFSAGTVPNPRGAGFEDRAGCIRATSASGKRLYLELSADQGHGLRAVYACRNGMIAVNDLTGELLASVREEPYRELPTTRYGMPALNTQCTVRSAADMSSVVALLKALLSQENSVSGEDGRRAIEILVAAYQSAEQGNVMVRMDAKLDRGRVFPWA
jgi:predicted dehydrogenase